MQDFTPAYFCVCTSSTPVSQTVMGDLATYMKSIEVCWGTEAYHHLAVVTSAKSSG